MPYPEALIAPMRQDLVQLGFKEMRTPDDVDEVLGRSSARRSWPSTRSAGARPEACAPAWRVR